MAPKLKTAEDWEDYDRQRMSQAVAEIAASPDLRFFFRSVLGAMGIADTPYGGDAIELSRACGRHEAGMIIVTEFLAQEPGLWPKLLVEDSNERLERDVAE